jgi:hypothetical protein
MGELNLPHIEVMFKENLAYGRSVWAYRSGRCRRVSAYMCATLPGLPTFHLSPFTFHVFNTGS